MVTPEEANRLSAIQQQSANVPGSVLVQATKQQADNSFVDGLTDFFSKAKEKTYGALKELRESFFYHFINAHGSLEDIRNRIDSELRYQGSLELDEETYDIISKLPIASSLAEHARQDLIDRLENYQKHHQSLFITIVTLISEDFMPIIKRHAISGHAVVNTENSIFDDPLSISILIDIFSDLTTSTTSAVTFTLDKYG